MHEHDHDHSKTGTTRMTSRRPRGRSRITLRDLLAGQVLAACWQAQPDELEPEVAARMAGRLAYTIADAAILEGNHQGEKQ